MLGGHKIDAFHKMITILYTEERNYDSAHPGACIVVERWNYEG